MDTDQTVNIVNLKNQLQKCIEKCQLFESSTAYITKLTLKASITIAADDKFCDIFPSFRKKIRYGISRDDSLEIAYLICYFRKAAKFETVVCCKL